MAETHLVEQAIFEIARKVNSREELQAYLQNACGDDHDLKQRVAALLRAYEDSESYLESPPPGLGASPAINGPVTERPGTVIGPYKLLQQIGEGGMGVVFMAEQTESIQRMVALKIIKAGMDTRQVIARFEAERQALALMDHPNIAKVLDAGTTDSGGPYFAMELVKGVPITKYCDDKQLSPRERLELLLPVCQAVQHAHQKGVIHRDIKPTNVLVAEYDNEPIPKVIDFGVAKATASKLSERTMFTEFGQVLGTVEYMSPEQAKLNQLDIDTRSDIYSLGVLMYELLTGSTPFARKRLNEAAFDEMLRIIREEEPPKPSTRLTTSDALPAIAANRDLEPHKLTALVRGELDWIVMKCLEKDRNRRYETASGFATDLQHYLDDEAVQACPPSAGYTLRKFARRNKAALTTAALVSLALVLGTLISTWQAVRAMRAERTAAAEAQRAKTEAAIARAVSDFLNKDLLTQANDNLGLPRYHAAELKLLTVLNRAADRIEGRFPDQPLVEAALRQTIGSTYLRFSESRVDLSRAAKHLQRAAELRRAHLGDEHPDTLASTASLASATGDADLADRVLRARRRILGDDDPATLWSMFSVAYLLDRSGENDRALAMFRKTLEANRRVLGEDHTTTAWTKHLVACVQRNADGNLGPDGAHGAEVERLYREALATLQMKSGDASWYTFDVTLRLGQFLNVPGHYDRAATVFQDGYLRLQSQPTASPEWSATLADELVGVYRSWHKPEQTAEWERKRLAANDSTLLRNLRLLKLRDLPDETGLLTSTGSLLFQLGRFGEAEAAYRAAIALDPKAAFPHQLFGDVLLDQRKLADAVAKYAEAIRLRPTEHGPHYGLGSAYAFGGQWEKAATAFGQATELSPSDLPSLFKWAALCFYIDDQENYRRACRALLDHFSKTDNIQVADCTAKACALMPGFGGDARQVVKLADVAFAETEADPARKWFEITQALVDFRAGRYQAAADIILQSAPSGEGFHRDALAFSILAMARHQVGTAQDQARDALMKAKRIISTKMPKTEQGETFGDDWHDWLHAQIICREAEQLLKEPAAPSQK